MNRQTDSLGPDAGTARLWIVIPVALLGFFYLGVLDYLLPLYFGALREVDPDYPLNIYSQLVKYQGGSPQSRSGSPIFARRAAIFSPRMRQSRLKKLPPQRNLWVDFC